MKEFSNTSKGMIKDVDILQPDQYSHSLNSLLESLDSFPTNDYSNILGYIFEENEDVLYKKFLPELDKKLLFTTKNRIIELSGTFNDTGFNTSVPLEYNNETPILTSKVLVQSNCFNWKIENKIDVSYKLTDSTLNLYISNLNDEDKYIYFNLKNGELSVEESFLNEDGDVDCNTIKWYPEISYPQINVDDTEGGTLKAGVYQFAVAYSTSKGVELTKYNSFTNPFHLFTKSLTDTTDYITGKAIKLSITNFNEIGRYRYINIAVLKTINEVSNYEVIATLPINTVVNYTYTGEEITTRVDEKEIFQIYPFYKSSKGNTKANNKLFKYGIKEFEKFNLQPLMHKFKLKWFTIGAKLGSYKSPEFAQKYRSYLRDEVYTFGIKFILDNGEETPVYNLIGRNTVIDDQLVIPNTADVIRDKECLAPLDFKRKWEVYNTAWVDKTSEIKLEDCAKNYPQYQEGEFAYWVSSDKYPNDVNVWGELANKPIRHFKFPDCSISPHYSNVDGEVVIHPIGVKLSEDVDVNKILQEAVDINLISQEQKNRIKKYKIVRGNRVGNKSIDAKGLIFNTFQYTENNKQVYYANYPFNDLRPDPYLSFESLKLQSTDWYKNTMYNNTFQNSNKYTFHSPNTHFNSPALGNLFKKELEMHGTAKGFFNKSKLQGEYAILSQMHYNFAIVIAWLMTERLELSKAQPGEQGGAIGSSIGAVAGGVIGSFIGGQAALGAVAGSALGGIIGKMIAGNTADDDYNATYRLSMWISQAERIVDLLKNTMPLQNYHWQYQAIGTFDKYNKITETGTINREIVNSAYLDGTRQQLPNEVRFNNNYRESSVYLELNDHIGVPSVQDTSRFLMSQKDCDINEGEEVLSKVSAFYGSIKRQILNQYGDVFSINWIPVSGKVWNLTDDFKEFGGDTFINAEAFKIKQNFFTNTTFKLSDGTDVYYEDQNNIAYPKHFFNTRYTELSNPDEISLKDVFELNGINVAIALNNLEQPKSLLDNFDTDPNSIVPTMETIANIFKRSVMNPYNLLRPGRYNLDCESDIFYEKRDPQTTGDVNDLVVIKGPKRWFKDMFNAAGNIAVVPNVILKFTGVKGQIYTYSYGIPVYIVESDINLDLRHAEDPNEGNFYPNITDLNYWLQEENVSPRIDNKYTYNRTYSKQNKEDITLKNDINFFKEKDKIFLENRIIESQQGVEVENSGFKDNYLYFKPLDVADLTYENGKLISIDSIESEQILLRFENNSRVINSLTTIPTTGAVDATLATGSLFSSRPQDFSKTDLGYLGSQHTDILHTPFGHIYIDSKGGNVINIQSGGKGVDELSKNGMRNWFAENLPFHISKYFPTVDVDNAYNDIGISMSYDNRYKRFFITKLDYIPKISGIEYRDSKFYFNNKGVRLTDGNYFCNASWTISYSFYTQTWRSFHSFTPNYYIDELNVFNSGLNGLGRGLSSLWQHNITNKSFQTYYGILRPFEIESVSKFSINPQIVTDVAFKLDVLRYHNTVDIILEDDVAFNKAIIYNDRQNSGLLELEIIDKNDLFNISKYPIKEDRRTKILLFKNETEYNFNQFEDLTLDNNLPRFLHACSGSNKIINQNSVNYNKTNIDNNYIRGDKVNVRLINDKTGKYKMIFKGLMINNTPSIR